MLKNINKRFLGSIALSGLLFGNISMAEGPVFPLSLEKDGITFTVEATNNGSINKVRILTRGLKGKNEPQEEEIDGVVTGVAVADLDGNKAPEIYLFVNSAGSGAYGSLVAYASNNNKSITPIYLPPLDPKSKEAKGYMGHDRFAIEGSYLVRTFPLYRDDDPNCCPSGGERKLYYKLVPGEAGWILKLEKSESTSH